MFLSGYVKGTFLRRCHAWIRDCSLSVISDFWQALSGALPFPGSPELLSAARDLFPLCLLSLQSARHTSFQSCSLSHGICHQYRQNQIFLCLCLSAGSEGSQSVSVRAPVISDDLRAFRWCTSPSQGCTWRLHMQFSRIGDPELFGSWHVQV